MTRPRLIKDRSKDKVVLEGRVEDWEVAPVASPVFIIGQGDPDYESLARTGLSEPIRTEGMPPQTTTIGINVTTDGAGALAATDLIAAVANRVIQVLAVSVNGPANNSGMISFCDGGGGTTVATVAMDGLNKTSGPLFPMNWRLTKGNAFSVEATALPAGTDYSIQASYRVVPE